MVGKRPSAAACCVAPARTALTTSQQGPLDARRRAVKHDVIGAVLAGGRGRRIGGDKPSLEVGDKTLVRYAVDALRSVGLEVALVLRPDQPVPLTAHTIATVRDEIEDAGPLAGLQALLRWLPVEWAVVTACDQPFLAPPLLRGLLAQARDSVDVVLPEGPNGPEPLPGLYP